MSIEEGHDPKKEIPEIYVTMISVAVTTAGFAKLIGRRLKKHSISAKEYLSNRWNLSRNGGKISRKKALVELGAWFIHDLYNKAKGRPCSHMPAKTSQKTGNGIQKPSGKERG